MSTYKTNASAQALSLVLANFAIVAIGTSARCDVLFIRSTVARVFTRVRIAWALCLVLVLAAE